MFKASDLQSIEELLLSYLTIITFKITPSSPITIIPSGWTSTGFDSLSIDVLIITKQPTTINVILIIADTNENLLYPYVYLRLLYFEEYFSSTIVV